MLPTAAVKIETVTTVEGIAALGPSYGALLEASGNTLPFALHEWHLAWCRHFLNCNPGVEEKPWFLVLRNETGRCVAVLPFVRSSWRIGPLTVVAVNFLGADPAITEVRCALIEPGYECLALHAAQQHLRNTGGWDWIHWTGLRPELADAIGEGINLQWQTPISDFVLDLAPTWEEFRSGLKRNIRESLRHCYNSLARDGHRFEFVVLQDPADMQAGLDRFLELHVLRAQLQEGVRHPNRFASQVSREFLYDVCRRLAECGAMRLFQLKIGGQVVASRIGFVTGNSLYLYYSGFDPRWARYSVMTTAVAEAIKYAIAQRYTTVNLSPAKDLSKSRWGPRQVDYLGAYQPGRRMRSVLAHRAYMTAKSGDGLHSWALQRLVPARRRWR